MEIKLRVFKDNKLLKNEYWPQFYCNKDLKENLSKYFDLTTEDGYFVLQDEKSLLEKSLDDCNKEVNKHNLKIKQFKANSPFYMFTKSGRLTYNVLAIDRNEAIDIYDKVSFLSNKLDSKMNEKVYNAHDDKYYDRLKDLLYKLNFNLYDSRFPEDFDGNNEFTYTFNGDVNQLVTKLGEIYKAKLDKDLGKVKKYAEEEKVAPFVEKKKIQEIAKEYELKKKEYDEFVRSQEEELTR